MSQRGRAKRKPPKPERCPGCGGMVVPVKVKIGNEYVPRWCLACTTTRKVNGRPDCKPTFNLRMEERVELSKIIPQVFDECRPTVGKGVHSEMGRMVDTATRPLG